MLKQVQDYLVNRAYMKSVRRQSAYLKWVRKESEYQSQLEERMNEK